MKVHSWFFLSGWLLFLGSPSLAQDPSEIKAESKLLGKPLRVESFSESTSSTPGLRNQMSAEVLGKRYPLLETSISTLATNSPAQATGEVGGANTDLYLNGTRIWGGNLSVQNGGVVYSGGVAPVQIPFPLIVYPLGPVVLELDAGLELAGDIESSLMPGLSYPLSDSSLDAKISAKLSAATYLEGYANFWLLRGGVGGRVSLIDGELGSSAHLFFDSRAFQSENFGKLTLLNGSIFAFVDTRVLFGRWTRILQKNFYAWDGLCYARGVETCPKP